jgi:hypothetical protein
MWPIPITNDFSTYTDYDGWLVISNEKIIHFEIPDTKNLFYKSFSYLSTANLSEIVLLHKYC